MEQIPINALFGGLLIGLAATLLLALNGRILGVSGIVAALLSTRLREPWRIAFVLGVLCGGVALIAFLPAAFENASNRSLIATGVAGLLVGFGTKLGSGCTSGHGVCGVSRLSPRSILATVTFVFTGMLTVFLIRLLFGGLV